jgi:hypothetical protein
VASVRRWAECVDFDVDYAAKWIRITVRIDFYILNLTSMPAQRHRAAAAHAADAVIRYWSGHKFKCFDVLFELDWRLVSFAEPFRTDALDVGLIDESTYVSRVEGERKSRRPENRLSDSPDALLSPITEAGPTPDPAPRRGAKWGLKVHPAVYPHEVGHILGLDDGYGYVDGLGVRSPPDHPPDLMSEQTYTPGIGVTPEMITKVIRRSGKVDEARIRCPLTLDMGPMTWNMLLMSVNDIRVHAWTCDYDPPSSDPNGQPRPMEFRAVIDYWGEVGQQVDDPLGLDASGQAHYEVEFPLRVPGDLEIQGKGIRFVGKGVEWSGSPLGSAVAPTPASGLDNLPYLSTGVMFLAGPEGQLLSTEACWPGPKLVPIFRHGAAECPE